MPTYDYVCRACGHRVEVHHGLYVEGPTQCPNCHSHAFRKAIAAPAIVFKGSGWAKKDRSVATSNRAAARDAADGEASGSSRGETDEPVKRGEPAKKGEPAKDREPAKEGEPANDGEPAKGGKPAKVGTATTDSAAAPASSGGSSPASGVD
jgi:putative FmdB family regulatory protein